MAGAGGVRTIPKLVDLCIQTAIDNVRYMGDVGETDILLLKEILPHCTADLLMHIENSTKGRDLSPVTDNLWKGFYRQEFGEENMNLVVRRMKKQNVVFKWKLLYEAKLKEREEAQKKSVEKMKKLYAAEGVKKQNRQIQICSKVPPSNKRSFYGGSSYGYNISNTKGNLMKKAKLDFVKSREVQVLRTISRSKNLQAKPLSSSSVQPSSSCSRRKL